MPDRPDKFSKEPCSKMNEYECNEIIQLGMLLRVIHYAGDL